MIVLVDQREPRGAGLVRLVVEHDRRVSQIIEKRFEAFVKERQPVLHPEMPSSGGNGRIEGIARTRRGEHDAVAFAKTRHRAFVHRELADRLEHDGVQLARRGLGCRVEDADFFELVAEEIEAHRRVLARREHIDDPAAHGEFAGFHDHFRGAVSTVSKERNQLARFQRLAGRGAPDLSREPRPRRNPLQDRRDCRHGHPRDALGARIKQRSQGLDAPAHDVRAWRDAVVRKTVPGGNEDGLERRRKEPHRLQRLRRANVVAGDEHQISAALRRSASVCERFLGPASKKDGVEPLGRAANRETPGAPQRFNYLFQSIIGIY